MKAKKRAGQGANLAGGNENKNLTGNYRQYTIAPIEEQAFNHLDMARPGQPDFLYHFSRFVELVRMVQDGH